jgi:hypothetical protein
MKFAFSRPFNLNQVRFRRQKRNFRELMGGSEFLQQMSNMEVRKEINTEKNEYLKNKEEILDKKNEREAENTLKNPLLLPKPWYDFGDNELSVIVPQPKNNEALVVQDRASTIKYNNRYDASTALSSSIEQSKTLRSIKDRMNAEAASKNKLKMRVSKYFK